MSAMVPASSSVNTLESKGISEVEALGTDEALRKLAQAFEMNWDTVHAAEHVQTDQWSMGQTIRFSLLASGVLWAAIVAVVWFV
jgi:hypothetical protein